MIAPRVLLFPQANVLLWQWYGAFTYHKARSAGGGRGGHVLRDWILLSAHTRAHGGELSLHQRKNVLWSFHSNIHQAQCVVCSDWNPEALRCLKVGLKLNNIDHGRAVVLEAGDSATLHERVNKCSALCSS